MIHPSPTPSRSAIPAFYLYGEPQREVGKGFVHVESLDDRSRPSEWTIEPHIHRDLAHIILIAEGGGSMRAEGEGMRFDAPCLLFVPAAIVHGFSWHTESRGFVMTLAVGHLGELLGRHPDLSPLFARAHVIELPADERPVIEAAIADTGRELGWNAPGRRAAVEAALLSIMTRGLRLMRTPAGQIVPMSGHHAAIVARLRERIDARFRLREPIGVHATALGLSPTALRIACASIAGRGPAAILDDRALLEARRLLLYSNLTVAQTSYAVGFEDPAYFSRFFTRHTGQSPRQYRERSGGGE